MKHTGRLFLACWMLASAVSAGCGQSERPTPAVPLHGCYEVRLDPAPENANPFSADKIAVDLVITHESGIVYELPAFWYREYEYALLKEGEGEQLTPAGAPHWRARFSPRRTGLHTCRWRIKRGKREREEYAGAFTATGSDARGPVVRKPSSRYMVTADGEPLFLIGHNVAWSTDPAPLADMLKYIDDLADSGQNCTRIWLCTWGFGFEHREMGQYDLERAWKLDRIVEHAQKRGVYIMFCFENAHDVSEMKSPYWVNMGGPIRAREEFFTHPAARRAFRNRLRYAAARWGYADSILAWELFNEMEYAVVDPDDFDSSVRTKYFLPWLNEMAAQLRRSDPHAHLVTNSLATDRVWDAMNELPWMDIVQHHTYLSRWDTDAAELVLYVRSWIDRCGKPYMLSEFGGAPPGVYDATRNVVHDTDATGLHIHNSIWAGALSGAASTPMNWWWDTYIRPRDCYNHYAALSRFLDGTPWLDEALASHDLSTREVRVLLLKGRRWARLWAQNKACIWPNARRLTLVPMSRITPVRIDGLLPGEYEIEWWDTLKGAPSSAETLQCDGTLVVEVPAMRTDIAARISLIREGR